MKEQQMEDDLEMRVSVRNGCEIKPEEEQECGA
jgi:hypothetical protein